MSVVGQILEGEVGPVPWDDGGKVESVVRLRYNAQKPSDDIAEIPRVNTSRLCWKYHGLRDWNTCVEGQLRLLEPSESKGLAKVTGPLTRC